MDRENSFYIFVELALRIGNDSIQNWILSIVNTAFDGANESKSDFKKKLDEASNILNGWLEEGKIELIKEGNSIKVNPIGYEKTDWEKFWTVKNRPAKTNIKECMIRKHSIANVNAECHSVLRQQENIPLVLTDLIDLNIDRTTSSGETNDLFEKETQIIQSLVKSTSGRIYQKYKYDRRGRLYTLSYPLSFQQDEWTRSCFELAHKEVCNEKGIRNLKIDIMNLLGFDSSVNEFKMDLFEDCEDTILKIAKGEASINDVFPFAKKPIRCLMAMRAYLKAIEGQKIGYLCSLDATASGAQIAAILSRDENAAIYTNLSDPKDRYDVYREVGRVFYMMKGHKNMKARLLAKENRKVFKTTCMIGGYNGKKAIEAAFPDVKDRELFYEAQSQVQPGLIEIQKIVNKAFEDNQEKPIMCWIMPDGFEVAIPQQKSAWAYVHQPKYSFSLKYYKEDISFDENKRAMYPHLIHSTDAYICREMLRRNRFPIVTVHDCFYAHPNNMGKVLKSYNMILEEVNQGTILEDFLSQVYGERMTNPFNHKAPIKGIEHAKYSLS